MGDRRIRIATLLSVLAHALVFSIPIRDRPGPPSSIGANLQSPLTVVLLEPDKPTERPVETVETPRILAARPKTAVRPESPRIFEPPPVPVPVPRPAPMPTFDMGAMIAATRERRRALEAAARGGAVGGPPKEDPGAAGLARNLQSMSRTDGTGGVFQILRKGERTAEFAFNGWQGDARRWREVIEVDAGPGGDVELAIVRRMIALIRTHYTGDFNWESHRLGRIIVLSARLEDTEGLEDFLQREFFGTPTLKPRR